MNDIKPDTHILLKSKNGTIFNSTCTNRNEIPLNDAHKPTFSVIPVILHQTFYKNYGIYRLYFQEVSCTTFWQEMNRRSQDRLLFRLSHFYPNERIMLLSSCLLTIVFRYTIGKLRYYRELIMSTNSVLFLLRY
ncbi:hypothetical protein PUN28_012255 [Cardiocondyla obscurior]|uniref:Uncharacterized protein n=1 Tax=Cardiocondyla obscurior TaxID=286306 RepID=A0AAW2FFJ1_9HYME